MADASVYVFDWQVLEQRIPFLLSSIKDFQQHIPSGQDSMVSDKLFCFFLPVLTFLLQDFCLLTVIVVAEASAAYYDSLDSRVLLIILG